MIRKLCKLYTDFQRSISFQPNIEVWIDGEIHTVGKVPAYWTLIIPHVIHKSVSIVYIR
jgi:hypothetical protein